MKIYCKGIFRLKLWLIGGLVCGTFIHVSGQLPEIRYGQKVPLAVRQIYDRGLDYLVRFQAADGSWPGGGSGQPGAGLTGICVMSFLASGTDPNYGPFAQTIQKGIESIIRDQQPSTGYLGGSMYHHGFGMLALAEAYGVVNDRSLFKGGTSGEYRTIGQALELAVRAAVTSQNSNPNKAWRYSPQATDADTSVAGAVVMGLLAARNAGIEVPDKSIDGALDYFKSMTSPQGNVGYAGGLGGFGDSLARSSIATLVMAVSRRKSDVNYKATADYLKKNLESSSDGSFPFYTRYYQAQAYFQADYEAWQIWNKRLIREIKSMQASDGSIQGNSYSTGMSLLALGLNYRFLPIYER